MLESNVESAATSVFGASADSFARALLKRGQIVAARFHQLERNRSGEIVGGLKAVRDICDLTATEFADETARYFQLGRAVASDIAGATRLDARFSRRFLREAALFPYAIPGEPGFRAAVGDPADRENLRAARLTLGGPIQIFVATFEDIAALLEGQAADETQADRPEAIEESVDSLRDLASGAPVVRAIDDLIERAVELRASDIHIEPKRSGFVVRLRVDGVLRETPAPAGAPHQALISRVKILAGLNIAERRLPQDGAARFKIGRGAFDARVATMPTQHGETAVIRLLSRDRNLLQIHRLGLLPRDEARVRRALDLPYGLIVICGPTGSGKTTTLATMLSILNTTARKILTIEDPIEYELPGVNQSQVKPAIGLTFAAAMRAFVRQDPDVIMVGEVRDAETAGIAVQAALTGHLVLTTLHTETAAAVAPRLIDLGVEAFLLRSTLRIALSQRLVRLLCERCRRRRELTEADLEDDPRYGLSGFMAGDALWDPIGCERCAQSGYRGRIGVFEAMEVHGETRDLIGPGVDAHRLDAAARRAGMSTMIEDAIEKCRSGVTSVQEAFRVTTLR